MDKLWKTGWKTQRGRTGVRKEGVIPAIIQTFPQKNAEKKYKLCKFAPK